MFPDEAACLSYLRELRWPGGCVMWLRRGAHDADDASTGGEVSSLRARDFGDSWHNPARHQDLTARLVLGDLLCCDAEVRNFGAGTSGIGDYETAFATQAACCHGAARPGPHPGTVADGNGQLFRRRQTQRRRLWQDPQAARDHCRRGPSHKTARPTDRQARRSSAGRAHPTPTGAKQVRHCPKDLRQEPYRSWALKLSLTHPHRCVVDS